MQESWIEDLEEWAGQNLEGSVKVFTHSVGGEYRSYRVNYQIDDRIEYDGEEIVVPISEAVVYNFKGACAFIKYVTGKEFSGSATRNKIHTLSMIFEDGRVDYEVR